MKILVTSDTHGLKHKLIDLITEYSQQVQMVIHLGDHHRDFSGLESTFPHLTLVAVGGTYDTDVDTEKILTLEKRKLLLLHGDRHGVKSGLDRLFYYAKEKQVDACLFGHTHFQTMFEREGILFMNPGCMFAPRDGSNGGYGIINITPEGEMTGEVIRL